MVIQNSGISYTSPRTSTASSARAWQPGRGSLCVKLCALGLAAAIVLVPGAFVHNNQRNLTESIRREEIRQRQLITELEAAKVLWDRQLNAASMERSLTNQGIALVVPSAEQIVMITPAHGSPSALPGPAGARRASAVAAR